MSRRSDMFAVLRQARITYYQEVDVVDEIDATTAAIQAAPATASDDDAIAARIEQLLTRNEPTTTAQAIVCGIIVGATIAFNHEADR